jgi:hypothetical protein
MMRIALVPVLALLSSPAMAGQVNLANTGFEVDEMNGSAVTVEYVAKRAMKITGYNFFLAMGPHDVPSGVFSSSGLSEVLFFVTISGIAPVDDFQKGVVKDLSGGKQHLHGGDAVPSNSQFAQAILKAEIGAGGPNSVNVPIAQSGLEISVPAGAIITIYAGHAGWGPVDFEAQGGFTYE